MDRRPPLAVSPRRLRPRCTLRSSGISCRTPPPAASSMETQLPKLSMTGQEPKLRPEYESISWELQALAKMVKEEFGNNEGLEGMSFGSHQTSQINTSPLFERGRFYELYAARRNERLKKRKKGETVEGRKSFNDLGVMSIDLGKKRTARKIESVRKSVPENFSVYRSYSLRSSVKSSKEMKKPSSIGGGTPARSSIDSVKRLGTRSCRRN